MNNKHFNTVWIQLEQELALVWDGSWVLVNLEDNTVLTNSDMIAQYEMDAESYVKSFSEEGFLGEVEDSLFHTYMLKYPNGQLEYNFENDVLNIENLSEDMVSKMILDFYSKYPLSNTLGDDWNETNGIFVVGNEELDYEEIDAKSIIEALYSEDEINDYLEKEGYQDLGEAEFVQSKSNSDWFTFKKYDFYVGDDAYVWEYFDENKTLEYALENNFDETAGRFRSYLENC